MTTSVSEREARYRMALEAIVAITSSFERASIIAQKALDGDKQ